MHIAHLFHEAKILILARKDSREWFAFCHLQHSSSSVFLRHTLLHHPSSGSHPFSPILRWSGLELAAPGSTSHLAAVPRNFVQLLLPWFLSRRVLIPQQWFTPLRKALNERNQKSLFASNSDKKCADDDAKTAADAKILVSFSPAVMSTSILAPYKSNCNPLVPELQCYPASFFLGPNSLSPLALLDLILLFSPCLKYGLTTPLTSHSVQTVCSLLICNFHPSKVLTFSTNHTHFGFPINNIHHIMSKTIISVNLTISSVFITITC